MARSGRPVHLAVALLLVAILGILAVPLLPWFSLDQTLSSGTTPQHYTLTAYGYPDVLRLAMSGFSTAYYPPLTDFYAIASTIDWISLNFWLAALFAGIGLIGAVTALAYPKNALGHIASTAGGLTILFGLLVLVGHMTLLGNLSALERSSAATCSSCSARVSFGYNYLPLLSGVLLLVLGIGHGLTTFRPAVAALSALRPPPSPPMMYYPIAPGMPGAPPGYGPLPPPGWSGPQAGPLKRFCAQCGTPLAGPFCQTCGARNS